MKYTFHNVQLCEMCKTSTENAKVLGQRLNVSQGKSPKSKKGIAVSVCQCRTCGLIFSNPTPVPANLEQHYDVDPETYWTKHYFTWTKAYFNSQLCDVERLLGVLNGLRALDVGAGIGKAMLSMMNRNMETYGIEPSAPFYDKAIEQMGIPKDRLVLGKIEDVEFEPNSFDFITFGAVFEHLYEPSKCIARALGWLKPGGIIHMEVPSADWLIARMFNMYYRLIGTTFVTNLSPMHSPFHIHEFTMKSFEYASRLHGFEIVMSRYHVASIYYVPKFLHPLLKWYMKRTNTGMQLTVYLRKV